MFKPKKARHAGFSIIMNFLKNLKAKLYLIEL